MGISVRIIFECIVLYEFILWLGVIDSIDSVQFSLIQFISIGSFDAINSFESTKGASEFGDDDVWFNGGGLGDGDRQARQHVWLIWLS